MGRGAGGGGGGGLGILGFRVQGFSALSCRVWGFPDSEFRVQGFLCLLGIRAKDGPQTKARDTDMDMHAQAPGTQSARRLGRPT